MPVAAVCGAAASSASVTSRPTIARAIACGVVPAVGKRATVRPPRSTVMVSDTATTSSSLCVISRIVAPPAASVRSTRHRSATSGGESTAVGSSRMSTRAPRWSALRISTRCASPTVRSATSAVGSTASPVSRPSAATAATAAARSTRPRVIGSAPSTTFSATVSVGTSMKCWCTIPTPAAIAARVSHPVTSRPCTCTVPASGACPPASTRISVLLPAPFSPTTAWISPTAASSEASRLAATPPKALAIPRRCTAMGAAVVVVASVMAISGWTGP